MAIVILGRKILMKEIKEQEEEQTASGLYIPDSAKKPKVVMKGEVISHGIDCTHVQAGDVVIYDAHSAVDMELEGEDYVLTDESSIFGYDRSK